MRVTVLDAMPSTVLASARPAFSARFAKGRGIRGLRAAPDFGAAVLLTDFRLLRAAGPRPAAFAAFAFDAGRFA
jgi:hypothetical protein